MDNQSSQSTYASFKCYMTSLITKIFRREAEDTGLDPESTEIALPLHETPSVDGDQFNDTEPEPEREINYLPRPPFDMLGPQEIRPWEQPAGVTSAFPFPPPHAPFDLLGPQAIRPWEQPGGVRSAFPYPPRPPFDMLGPQAIRPFQQPAGVGTAFPGGPGESLGERDGSMWLPALRENPSEIYKAALTGDWETAERFFQQDRQRAQAVISSRWETPLHVAVGTGKANDFVRELLRLLPDEAVAIKDFLGDTALHYAARVGNEKAAAMLVDRKPDMQYITNSSSRLPLQIAAIHCQKEILTYLIRKSDPGVENNNPFVGDLGVRLLMAVTTSGFFDVALDLVDKYPDLARSTTADGRDDSALSTLARMSSAFPRGESFSFWHNFICRSRSIGRKKVMHQQALELVNSLCQNIASLPYYRASAIYEKSIILAAIHGNHEVVRVIAEIFPTSIFAKDSTTGRDIFSLAAAERHENVFNLIYDMSDRKFNFYDSVDLWGNNFMHLCADIAPSHKLDLVPGPALQMQRELQWFKEVEKFVHPSRREWPNSKLYTPRMLFSEKHQKLKTEGEAWMRSTANSCSVAAALVATIMFAAAFTVPGGVNSESGIPIFRDKFPFLLFVISDVVSLFTSLTSLLMFLSILTSRYAEEDFLYVLPRRSSIGLLALFISVTFMMAAFGATMYLMLVEKDAWLLIPVAALACLPVASFVLLQFPLLIDVVYSTYGPGIFGKKTGKLLY